MSEVAVPRPVGASNPAIGIAGFVCALVGLVVPVLGLLGLTLSIVGYRQAKRLGMKKRLSIAGIVVGALSTMLYLLVFVVVLALVSHTSSSSGVAPFLWA